MNHDPGQTGRTHPKGGVSQASEDKASGVRPMDPLAVSTR